MHKVSELSWLSCNKKIVRVSFIWGKASQALSKILNNYNSDLTPDVIQICQDAGSQVPKMKFLNDQNYWSQLQATLN